MAVTFVQMPYVAIERPSIALGTLAACLHAAGIEARTLYANLTFAERIGLPRYELVNHSNLTLQIGEWTFAAAAFREQAVPPEPFLAGLPAQVPDWPGVAEQVRELRHDAARLIDDLAAEIVAASPRIVGCSSVFQQHCASLALLRRIRELAPEIVTMMGGANCEGSMGAVTHEHYPWVDYIVSGEADLLLPQLCRRILEAGPDVPAEELPSGVLGPGNGRARTAAASTHVQRPAAQRAVVQDLDALPIPCFDDYFEQLAASGLRASVVPAIPFESSRGCWWGQKQHCTFCGLNGTGMAFRAKSQGRIVDEIATLASRHQLDRFMGVDNILDSRYFAQALPALRELGGLSLFYETKANLSRQQVRELSDAGVCWIQPGIEALHDNLLDLLKKGTTVCINVQLLKWARTYGIWVIWNHLFGAPGDRPEWYEEIADWLPLIAHLQAPAGAGLTRIRYDRFSPYFERAQEFGLDLEPYRAYSQVYPLDAEALARQAYFFVDRRADSWYPERLQTLMDAWGKSWFRQRPGGLPAMSASAPQLAMADDGESIRLRDTRPCAVAASHVLIGLDAEVYRACDAARSPSSLAGSLLRAGTTTCEDEVHAAVARLIELKVLARFGDRLLSLATGEPARPYRGFESYPGGLACLPRAQRPPQLAELAPVDFDSDHFDPGDVPLRQLFAPSMAAGTDAERG